MPLLPLALPANQNWSCHNCGGCCRQHAIDITAEEHARILAQNWSADEAIGPHQPQFVRTGIWPWSRRYRLAHRPDGACVFLDERGLCRIHARLGESAKPLACRVYPYAFHPAGKKIAVSLRFSCPSVVANRGRPLGQQHQDLKILEKLVVPDGAERMPAPEVTPGQRLDWADTLKFVGLLAGQFAPGPEGVVPRLLRALKLVDLIGQSRFDKLRGARLDEYLEIVEHAVAGELSHESGPRSEPSLAGRMQFRMLCAQYARRDTFAEQSAGWGNRWRLLRAAVRFARGRGLVPPVQDQFVEVPFAQLEQSFEGLPGGADELLTRYLRVKIEGLHFCGAAYYNVPLLEGFQSLALVIPVVLWLARWLAAGDGRQSLTIDDLARALSIADHHHGYSPAFGQRGFRGRVRLLARLNEISKLIAAYSR